MPLDFFSSLYLGCQATTECSKMTVPKIGPQRARGWCNVWCVVAVIKISGKCQAFIFFFCRLFPYPVRQIIPLLNRLPLAINTLLFSLLQWAESNPAFMACRKKNPISCVKTVRTDIPRQVLLPNKALKLQRGMDFGEVGHKLATVR